MPYSGVLRYEKIKGKESYFGRPVYRLIEPFSWSDGKHSVECEAGFQTDFASIPEWIVFLNPKDKKWKEASVIHDKACRMTEDNLLTYRTADAIFYHAMRDAGTGKYVALTFWLVVSVYHKITRV